MPYIPKEHEQYDLLPLCRKDGGEVFDYPSKLIFELEQLLGSSIGIFPYNFDSYSDYFDSLDMLIEKHVNEPIIRDKLYIVRDTVLLLAYPTRESGILWSY